MAHLLWTQKQDIGPEARSSVGMAFDAARGRIVLFGGQIGIRPLRDTWEWDGSLWTQAADMGPAARGGHAMTYDSNRKRIVLFGGNGAAPACSEIPGSGTDPSGRKSPIPAPLHGRVMPSPTTATGSAWCSLAASTRAIKRLPIPGPGTERSGHRNRTPDLQHVLITSWLTTVRAIESCSLAEMTVDSPDRRRWRRAPHSLRRHPVNDTWEYDGARWVCVDDTGPAARGSYGMDYDSIHVLLYGGSGMEQTYLAILGHGTESIGRNCRTSAPGLVRSLGMAFDSARQRVVLFGGLNAGSSPLGDTWETFEQAIQA